MKNNFSEILDGLNAEETEILLEGLALSDEIPEITSARLKKTALKRIKANGKAKKTVMLRILPKHWRAAAAACLAALILAGAGGGYAYAENKEYKEAIAFFSENELSAEGLTRAEIKRVYRDIKTESFTYSKTAEVISRNMAVNRVPGYEILQNSPSPIDLKNAWDFKWFKTPPKSMGVHYDRHFDNDNGSFIDKYDNDKLLWSVRIEDFEVWGFDEIKNGVTVYGVKTNWREVPEHPGSFLIDGDLIPMLAKLDANGNILWERVIDTGLEESDKNTCIVKVLEESDGSYAVFSNVFFYMRENNEHYLCLSRYSADGDIISVDKQETESDLINVVHFGEGYLMQFYDTSEARGSAKLALTDLNGAVAKEFMYDSDESYYFIKDMAEFGGKIYLSAYAVPKESEKHYGELYGRVDIGAVLDYIDENHIFEKAQGQDYDGNYYNEKVQEAMSEQLVPVMRANHTAVLLVCDPAGGKPREFYSVEGSMGGSLSVNAEGELSWNVESIVKTYFSPATNAFTIYGQSRVFKYVFGAGGNLISQTETDETVPFMF